jgi:hypothetical protein
MRQHLGWVIVGLAFWVAVPGCGPNVSTSDLGTIVYEVPTVAGADEPYEYPELPPLQHGAKHAPKGPPGSIPPGDLAPPPSH